jgi:carbonic anhydrase
LQHSTKTGLSRRGLFGCLCGLGAGAGLSLLPAAAVAAAGKKTELTADQALALLKQGNQSFITEAPFRSELGRERRVTIAAGQTPFAILVSCSDSRVSPELLFGRGLGELFIVRNAGNTVDTVAMGSVEYGVLELGVPLIIVLGHERCGAVDAAVQVVEKNATFPGAIGQMVEPIIPAVLKVRGQEGDLLENSVRENVRRITRRLREDEAVITDYVKSGRLKIVGARYDLNTGEVDFFDEA